MRPIKTIVCVVFFFLLLNLVKLSKVYAEDMIVSDQTTNKPPLTGNIITNSVRIQNASGDLAILSRYQIILVIDESTSMLGHDCSVPDHGLLKKVIFGSNVLLSSASQGLVSVPVGRSRFTFSVNQVKAFLSDIASIFPQGLTIYTYGLLGHTYKNVTADSIDRLFKYKIPFGGTWPSASLYSIFKTYFKECSDLDKDNKPLLVVILSDCGINYSGNSDVASLHNVLASAIKKMSYLDQITVCFCKTGASPGGQGDVEAINNAPLIFGHKLKYNILRYIGFHDLREDGLTLALIRTLKSQPHNYVNQ